MDRDIFYRKLVKALLDSDFRFQAKDFSQEEVLTDRDNLSISIRIATKIAPSIIRTISDVYFPRSMTEIHPFFEEDGIQQQLNKIRDYATLVCFKYLLSQPVVISIVEADKLSPENIQHIAEKFDEVILDMRKFTGKMGGLKIGSIHLGGTRLSVTGIILIVFFDHTLASSFIKNVQEKCKIQHFLEKTWVVPWVIDISSRTVTNHSGLPFLLGVLNKDYLQKEIFEKN